MRPTDWDVLDLSSDPTPGDPTVVTGLAREWDSVADDAEAAERGVRSLASDGAVMSWIGAAGDVFKDAIGQFPGQLAKCKDSYRAGASALSAWSRDLDGAQAQADRALALGREARADLASAQASLESATSAAATAHWTALGLSEQASATPAPATGTPPDPDAVRSAVRNAHIAQNSVRDAQGAVRDAQTRLEAARKMALDAKQLRESRGRVTAQRIQDAAEAGVKPNSFMHDLKNVAGQVWDAVITIAKVFVAVLGVVALIIGGPIAWVVFAAAMLVLADTLWEASQGRASAWDVTFALLDCIPGTKGLTTGAKVIAAYNDGSSVLRGSANVGTHLVGAGLEAAKGMRQGAGALPGMVTNFVRSDGYGLSKLQRMSAQVVHGVPAATKSYFIGLGHGFADGEGALGRTWSALSKADALRGEAYSDAFKAYQARMAAHPARAAKLDQGTAWYPGIDRWRDVTMPAGSRMEQGVPGPGAYGVPEGTIEKFYDSAEAYYRAVQVGPDTSFGPGYRHGAVTYHFKEDVPAAVSVTAANPQYGPGGQTQIYVPRLGEHVLAGRVEVLDANGTALPTRMSESGLVIDLGAGQPMKLTDLVASAGTPQLFEVEAERLAARQGGRVAAGIVTLPWDFAQQGSLDAGARHSD